MTFFYQLPKWNAPKLYNFFWSIIVFSLKKVDNKKSLALGYNNLAIVFEDLKQND